MVQHVSTALKFLQWLIRAIQFCCAATILSLFSYFLATLSNRNFHIDTWIRAVEGISGAAVLYTLIGLTLLCCLAGYPLTSFIAIFLDVCFVGSFIYLAVVNRVGAGSCSGHVNTVFGTGDAGTNVRDPTNLGSAALPSLSQACRMQTACLAVAIVATVFFTLSAIVEFAMVRQRDKEKRFGPGPDNNYTSGYGTRRRGFFGGFGRKQQNTGMSDDPNALPSHTTPADVRDSYATEQTRVGTSQSVADRYTKYGESGYTGTHTKSAVADAPTPAPPTGHLPFTDPCYTMPPTTQDDVERHQHNGGSGITGAGPGTSIQDPGVAHYPPGNYRYDDGTYNARESSEHEVA